MIPHSILKLVWVYTDVQQVGLQTPCIIGCALGVSFSLCFPRLFLAILGGVLGMGLTVAIALWLKMDSISESANMVKGKHMVVAHNWSQGFDFFVFEDERLAQACFNKLGPVARIRFDDHHREVETWGQPIMLKRIRDQAVSNCGGVVPDQHMVVVGNWHNGIEYYSFASEGEAAAYFDNVKTCAKIRLDAEHNEVDSWGAGWALARMRNKRARQEQQPMEMDAREESTVTGNPIFAYCAEVAPHIHNWAGEQPQHNEAEPPQPQPMEMDARDEKKNNQSRGFVYVDFENEAARSIAILANDNTNPQFLALQPGKTLKVEKAKPKSTPTPPPPPSLATAPAPPTSTSTTAGYSPPALRLGRRIFVSGLARTPMVTDLQNDLKLLFESHGCTGLITIRIMLDPKSHFCRGFAFVDFDNAESVTLALKQLNGLTSADVGNIPLHPKSHKLKVEVPKEEKDFEESTVTGNPTFAYSAEVAPQIRSRAGEQPQQSEAEPQFARLISSQGSSLEMFDNPQDQHMVVVGRLNGVEYNSFETEAQAAAYFNNVKMCAKIRLDAEHKEVESWGASWALAHMRSELSSSWHRSQ